MHTRTTILVVVIAAALQILVLQTAAAREWLSQREPQLGFAYSYPIELFQEIEGDNKPSFHLLRIAKFGREVSRRWLGQSSGADS
jgi:hypothetical protein